MSTHVLKHAQFRHRQSSPPHKPSLRHLAFYFRTPPNAESHIQARASLAAPQGDAKKSASASICMPLTSKWSTFRLQGHGLDAIMSPARPPSGFLPHTLVLEGRASAEALGGTLVCDIPGVGTTRKVGNVDLCAGGVRVGETGVEGGAYLPAVVVKGRKGKVVHVTISLATLCRSVHVCTPWVAPLTLKGQRSWMRVQLRDYLGGGVWERFIPWCQGYAVDAISHGCRRFVFREIVGEGGVEGWAKADGCACVGVCFACGAPPDGAGAAKPKLGDNRPVSAPTGGEWGNVSWCVSRLCSLTSARGGGLQVEARGGGEEGVEGEGEGELPDGWTRLHDVTSKSVRLAFLDPRHTPALGAGFS